MEDIEKTGKAASTSTTPATVEAASASRHKLSVGCDRQNPCARCTRLGVVCTYALGYKARPKRAVKPGPSATAERGHLEAKIDDLSERLGKLFVLLEDSSRGAYSSSSLSGGRESNSKSPWQICQPDGGDDLSPADEESQYTGDSSLAAHANFTTDVLESALQSNASHSGTDEVQSFIQTVRDTIRRSGTSAIPSPGSSGSKLVPETHGHYLPPVQLTLECLRILKESPLISKFWIMCFDSVGQVTNQLLGLYTLQTISTPPELVITYIGLHSLFLACARTLTCPERRARYLEEANSCQEIADVVLARLPLHLPTTVECVLAMTMAAEYCISQCKTVTAWTYVSVASRMSQALGLHRVACEKTESFSTEARQNSKLFWSLYIIEKNLSLQLGRSSTINDHDLTLPLRDVRLGYEWGSTLGILSSTWLQLAQIEGRVYEELYSPLALTLDQEERVARAATLLADVQRITDEGDQPNTRFMRERRKVLGGQLDDLLTRCDHVSHLSFVCLIHRSVTLGSTSFSEECISTAREALKQYTETMSLEGTQDAFLFELCTHWSMLAVTSAPFFVVLCNAVWTLQTEDLRLLGSFVKSLESAESEESPSATHLLGSFKPLHDAAVHYFELRHGLAPPVADASIESISFGSIYDDMVSDMDQELFPMQWQAVPLDPFDQTSFGMYGGRPGHP
ncbi:fungal specific transcription factor [Colletotrichum truncatum]|uniref:Fungal specific transcription factor n=1 Tax=Colletotrichum truncatum TaxID=5467 RepID=A0ACC3YHV4_COLTU